jgi:pentalenene oxygenase
MSTFTVSLAARVLSSTIFSDRLPAAVLDELRKDLHTFTDGIYLRMVMVPPLDRLPTPYNRRYNHARNRFRRTISAAVAERRASGTDHGDVMSALLAARDPDDNSEALTDNEITDTVISLTGAGAEASAATLAWAFYLLGRHPQVEERLHAEVDAVLAGNQASFDDVPKLELTGRIVTEALRLYPPVWMSTRTATAETRLGPHLLPRGTTIGYSPYILHHRSDLYDRPMSFDPDRWDIGRHKEPTRGAFIPFGGGPRICIGDTFGMTEAIVALATIATHWRLQPLSPDDCRLALGGILRPRDLHLRAVPRAVPGTASPGRDTVWPGLS